MEGINMSLESRLGLGLGF